METDLESLDKLASESFTQGYFQPYTLNILENQIEINHNELEVNNIS